LRYPYSKIHSAYCCYFGEAGGISKATPQWTVVPDPTQLSALALKKALSIFMGGEVPPLAPGAL
jgi:hypothetical protein